VDESAVRSSADAVCEALVAGDVERAIAYLSDELRRNLGEVLALLPLPVREGTIESIERGASAFVVVLRLLGETEESQVQTRWKDRDGEPRIVEVSHLSRTVTAAETVDDEELEGRASDV
jgi:hypothetical protein